jgi:hypothetical protein
MSEQDVRWAFACLYLVALAVALIVIAVKYPRRRK